MLRLTSRLINLTLKNNCNKSNKLVRMVYSLAPPKNIHGMKELDRDAFSLDIDVPCMTFNSPDNKIMVALKKYLLKLRNLKCVEKHENSLKVYLDPSKIEEFNDIDKDDRDVLAQWTTKVDKEKLTIKYDNWKPEQIFKAILPEDVEVPTSYTTVGHILHLNLRDNQLPFKNVIGQVYLDTMPSIKTVVNKLGNIDSEYRHFSMEILAGENNTIATVKESNCLFTFDFAKVYWNSRLSTEHNNLLNYMVKDDVLYDVFAGVGPFAIPAARKGVIVFANDLNPESFKWLESNAAKNKAKSVKCFNKDGRDFLRDDVKSNILLRRSQQLKGTEHIAMNLPALAHEFLDVFHDWMDDNEKKELYKNPPLVHLYCFVKVGKNDDPKPAAKTLVESSLNCELTSKSLKIIHHVRNVAPNKEMMRVSFYLTEDLINKEEPMRKKLKSENINNKIDEFSGENGKEQSKEKCLQSTTEKNNTEI